ncbi:MAG: alpha/beta-type small acid-soluble spore protein [bacterium]|nr:alpha/beta-type small acid-soluble spore protein [bacterium]MDO5520527.1 alpha/beta-type small acid-soluble spore protein [bacterium]
MANNNTGSNNAEYPQAREALDRMKMEVASEIGVPLKQGYNGDLTSAQNGSVGGEMVRQMIRNYEQQMSGQK